MIIEDYDAIAKQLKRIQEQEMRVEKKSQKEIDDDAADDCLIGNDEETNVQYDDIYVGCEF